MNIIISIFLVSFHISSSPVLCFSGVREHRPTSALHAKNNDNENVTFTSLLSRRNWIGLMSSIFYGTNAYAEDTSNNARTVPTTKSVVILGANGGTGRECVSAVLASGRSCYATTRSGLFNYDEESSTSLLSRNNPKLFREEADVTNLHGLMALVNKINSNPKLLPRLKGIMLVM